MLFPEDCWHQGASRATGHGGVCAAAWCGGHERRQGRLHWCAGHGRRRARARAGDRCYELLREMYGKELTDFFYTK
jgi:hypothetical protein